MHADEDIRDSEEKRKQEAPFKDTRNLATKEAAARARGESKASDRIALELAATKAALAAAEEGRVHARIALPNANESLLALGTTNEEVLQLRIQLNIAESALAEAKAESSVAIASLETYVSSAQSDAATARKQLDVAQEALEAAGKKRTARAIETSDVVSSLRGAQSQLATAKATLAAYQKQHAEAVRQARPREAGLHKVLEPRVA